MTAYRAVRTAGASGGKPLFPRDLVATRRGRVGLNIAIIHTATLSVPLPRTMLS